jgi:hypothetical protein
MSVAGSLGMISPPLQTIIRELLRLGRLPRQREIRRTWTGPGLDQPCAACGHAVTPDDLDLELEFDDLLSDATATYRFHVTCHAVWEQEREAA